MDEKKNVERMLENIVTYGRQVTRWQGSGIITGAGSCDVLRAKSKSLKGSAVVGIETGAATTFDEIIWT